MGYNLTTLAMDGMNLLAKKSTYYFIKGLGFFFLFLYLYIYRDFSFSYIWVLVHILIATLVATFAVNFDLQRYFPILGEYLFLQQYVVSDESEYARGMSNYLLNMFKGWSFFLTPGEDGFICVPVLLIGINPITALIGGLVFGLLHIGRFTYYECLYKAVIYALVCFFILPYGLLTVVVGHMTLNAIAWISLKKLQKPV